MKERLAQLMARPGAAHLLRAVERFGARLGTQFGAAITYFSVLALVPLLMLAFSITGFILTRVRPDLLDDVVASVSDALGGLDQGAKDKILSLVKDYLNNYAAIFGVGLVAALYSGANWMGNLRNAVRAQWRPDFDLVEAKENIVVKILGNLVRLLGLIVAVLITFGLAALSTSLADQVVSWLGLSQIGWLTPLLRFVPIVLSIAAGWLLFMYLYTALPETEVPKSAVRRGALMGSFGLAALQYLASFLIKVFTGNQAAGLFGPVIVIMLFFNIFATLILFVAAWIATTDQPAIPEEQVEERVRFVRQPEEVADPALIPEHVAVRSVRVGMGAGYVTGAATGVGLGAVIAAVAGRLGRRRTRDGG